ncbi:uncharacterized protein EAF02_005131 [Botrytis sinoallii]|uniref:uncharacterized protein n=1 Tax=Botrytis sinoallii TaxID=1463999 RepID=UPI001902057F|nr:uncharacterized protein EAF02_005131 [Botrytis sinoallii]KAF7883211.1 hypothetical protein EAF02_005131 [Botrytis sinoallii]
MITMPSSEKSLLVIKWLPPAKRSLDSCSGSLKHRQLNARSVARRAEAARSLRAKRDIKTLPKKFRRDLATLEVYEAINHNQTGETIRQDVTEGQAGVPLHLEVQYIDITTCEPVPEVYVDIWNANATGVYGGINVTGNVADGGYDSTFLRATDSDGVATFDTIFPAIMMDVLHIPISSLTLTLPSLQTTLFKEAPLPTLVNFSGTRFSAAQSKPHTHTTPTPKPLPPMLDDMWSIVQAENDFDPFPEFMY